MESSVSDAAPAAAPEPLVERFLRTCGQALYPHLDLTTRRALRLTGHATLHAIDTSVHHLLLSGDSVAPTKASGGDGTTNSTAKPSHGDDTTAAALQGALNGNDGTVTVTTTAIINSNGTTTATTESGDDGVNTSTSHGGDGTASATPSTAEGTATAKAPEAPAGPAFQQLIATCSQRWPGAKKLSLVRLMWLDSLEGLPPRLESLVVVGSLRQPSREALEALVNVGATLKQLELKGINLRGDGTAALAGVLGHLTALTQLRLQEAALANDAFAVLSPTLARLTHLQQLVITEQLIARRTATSAQPLAEALTCLPDLRELQLRVPLPRSAGRELAPALASLTRLTCLDLSSNSLGPTGGTQDPAASLFAPLAEPLGALPSLSLLDLSGTDLGSAITLFPDGLNSLKVLRMSEAGLNGWGAPLAAALTHLPHLTELDLGRNFLNDADAPALAPALAGLTHLINLNLAACVSVPRGAVTVLPSLSSLAPTLRSLVLSHCVLGELEATELPGVVRSLSALTGLQRLELIGAMLGLQQQAATLLAELLTGLPELRHLDLTSNSFDADSAQLLAPGLVQLHKLQELRLGMNQWGVAGLETLLTPLQGHASLEDLDVSYVLLAGGVRTLLPVLGGMRALKRLCVSLRSNECPTQQVSAALPKVQVTFCR